VQVVTRHTTGDTIYSVVSSPAPRCRRRYKVGDCAPSATLSLARLAVQGAVSVVSTWGGGEGRRRRGGRGRRAGTQAQARPRSHPPAPTSSPLDIPRRQLLRSTRARACTRARVTRWAPPRPMNHLLTTYREGRKMNMHQNRIFATPSTPHPGQPKPNPAYLDQKGGVL
jgi:hypothetical protein